MKNNNLLQILNSDNSFATRYFTFRFKKLPQVAYIRMDVDIEKLLNLIHENYIKGEDIEDEFYEHGYCTNEEDNNLSVDIVFKKGVIIMFHTKCRILKIKYLDEAIEIKDKLLELIKNCQIKTEDEISFYMISSARELYLQKIKLDIDQTYNIEDLYNEDLIEKFDIIENFVVNESNGLTLLHGLPGSGKTSFIKFLIKKYPTKKFIYVPNNIFKQIDGPSFIQFFSDNEHRNSILVIEDAEALLIDRNDGNESISTLLNLSEGFLGKALEISVILTFNCPVQNIDSSLLRKGRLKCIYEFNELSIEKSKHLFKILNYDVEINQPMTLADILNYNIDNGLQKKEERKKIGF